MDTTLELPSNQIRTIVRDQPLGRGIVPSTFEEATQLANALFQTGVFSVGSAKEAVAKVIIGADFGFSAAFSMMNLYIFKGNIGMEYPAMQAVVKRAGYDYQVIEQTDKRCEIQFLRPDGSPAGPPVKWTAEDSRRAGTQNMEKFPQAMLFARAFSMGCRMYCADAFAGAVYAREEVQTMEWEDEQKQQALPQPVGSSEKLAAKIKRNVDDTFDPFPEPVSSFDDDFSDDYQEEPYTGETVRDE